MLASHSVIQLVASEPTQLRGGYIMAVSSSLTQGRLWCWWVAQFGQTEDRLPMQLLHGACPALGAAESGTK